MCDICGRPATSHYSYATSTMGGGQPPPAPRSISLCAEHAAIHERDRCRASLAQIVKSLERSAFVGNTSMRVQLHITAEDERKANIVARALRVLCGGESLVLSPEQRAERRRQLMMKHYPKKKSSSVLPSADPHWSIEWDSDPTISLLDRWQCGGWSQRLGDLILDQGCKLMGWSVGRMPNRNAEV